MVTAGVQAVVLAGGEGSRLNPLVDAAHPKSLLPICNVPVVEGPLLGLRRCGLCNVVVVVAPESEALFEAYVSELKVREKWAQLNLWVRKENEGTAEVVGRILKECGDHSGEVVVIAGDLVGGLDVVRRALETSRKRSDMLTVVLGVKDCEREGKSAELFALFPKDGEERLLALTSATDLEASILRVRPSHLQRYPALTLRSDVIDPHVYVLKKPVIELLTALRDIWSLRHDFVPAIAKKQFQLERKGDYGERFTVSAMLIKSSEYVRRVATLDDYLRINLEVAAGVEEPKEQGGRKTKKKERPVFASAGERANISPGSVLGSNVKAGSKTSVKKSIVGSDVTLGSNVKMNNCVIMSNSLILDKVNLSHCVIGTDCRIMSHVVLKNCHVGHGVTVEAGTEKENQVISEKAAKSVDSDNDFFEMVP